MPSDMFQPRGAQVIKSKAQGNGEYEAEFRVRGGNVHALAQQAIKHAQSKGYRLVAREIDNDDADLKFRKGKRELNISIEQKDHGIIEIDEDLDIEN
ncbi:hypothetical protein [Kingella negevensis]|nr:hypothetical protein [Kingella negevensis]MDK4689374.1 hypothetical protein [Kingella negevensis]WII90483.1 hypothetical protein QEO93_08495 [Kingella negevensis]